MPLTGNQNYLSHRKAAALAAAEQRCDEASRKVDEAMLRRDRARKLPLKMPFSRRSAAELKQLENDRLAELENAQRALNAAIDEMRKANRHLYAVQGQR